MCKNIIIGIDPSINSTGVCVNDNGDIKYYLIPSKCTKKMNRFRSEFITILKYDKKESDKNDNYIIKEFKKTCNIHNIANKIKMIFDEYKPSHVTIEGQAFSARGNVLDLAGLNYAIRLLCLNNNINFIIASPTEIKKFAVGNGQANKDVIISAWEKCDNRITPNLKKEIGSKIDDLADSYFMMKYKTIIS